MDASSPFSVAPVRQRQFGMPTGTSRSGDGPGRARGDGVRPRAGVASRAAAHQLRLIPNVINKEPTGTGSRAVAEGLCRTRPGAASTTARAITVSAQSRVVLREGAGAAGAADDAAQTGSCSAPCCAAATGDDVVPVAGCAPELCRRTVSTASRASAATATLHRRTARPGRSARCCCSIPRTLPTSTDVPRRAPRPVATLAALCGSVLACCDSRLWLCAGACACSCSSRYCCRSSAAERSKRPEVPPLRRVPTS